MSTGQLAWRNRVIDTLPSSISCTALRPRVPAITPVARRSSISRNTAEIGYWLGELFWGRGIMSEALHAVTLWSMQEFQLTRIAVEERGRKADPRWRAAQFPHRADFELRVVRELLA